MSAWGVINQCLVFLATCSCLSATEVLQQKHPAEGDQHIVPLHRQRVLVRNDDDVVSFKSVYFGDIFLGAPERQSFSMLFDTGSGHVIVPSVACRTEGCAPHRRYDHELSKVGVAITHDGLPIQPGAERDNVEVAFGTGEVKGQFASDRLCLGSISKPTYADTNISNQSFERSAERGCIDMRVITATDMSDEPFSTFSFDGVFGLGLDSLAVAPEFSFFNMFAAHGNIAHPSFGIFLAESDDDFSEISFGGHNPRRISSELAWAPVAMPEEGHWQVQINAIRIGGRTLDFCADGQCRAVVDSGTSSIAVPSSFSEMFLGELVDSMKDPLSSENGMINCKQALGQLLEFDIAGTTLNLAPGDYARAAVHLTDEDGEAEEDAALAMLEGRLPEEQPKKQLPAAKCHPTFMAFDLPEPLGPKLFILGEPVLRKYYTVYDWAGKSIGFGLAHQSTTNEKEPGTDVRDDSGFLGRNRLEPLLH